MIYTLNLKTVTPSIECKELEVNNNGPVFNNDFEGSIIQWIGENEDPENFIVQAILVNYCVKNRKPILILDYDSKLKFREYDWIAKKTESCFTESYIMPRKGFQFLPKPININLKYEDFHGNNNQNNITLISLGSLSGKEKDFRDYYIRFAEIEKNIIVLYEDKEYIDASDIEQRFINYKGNINVKEETPFMTIMIGTTEDYKRGYINHDMFSLLEMGNIVFIPEKHRYLHAIFSSLVLEDNPMKRHIIAPSTVMELRGVYLHDVFRNIRKYFPEFSTDYTNDVIKDFFK